MPAKLSEKFQTTFNWFSTLPLQLRKRICIAELVGARSLRWGCGRGVQVFAFRRPVTLGCATSLVIQPHGQRDAFSGGIDFQPLSLSPRRRLSPLHSGSWTVLDKAEMCTKPSWWTPVSTNAPKLATLETPSSIMCRLASRWFRGCLRRMRPSETRRVGRGQVFQLG